MVPAALGEGALNLEPEQNRFIRNLDRLGGLCWGTNCSGLSWGLGGRGVGELGRVGGGQGRAELPRSRPNPGTDGWTEAAGAWCYGARAWGQGDPLPSEGGPGVGAGRAAPGS